MKRIITILSICIVLLLLCSVVAYADDPSTYNGHVYMIFETHSVIPWQSAKEKCETYGGHLVTITSPGEQKFIDSINTKETDLWIGGYFDLNNSEWKWVTDESWSYENWERREPNNAGGDEYCVAVWPQYWNDLNNNSPEQSGYICEWESIEAYNNNKEIIIANTECTVKSFCEYIAELTGHDDPLDITNIIEDYLLCNVPIKRWQAANILYNAFNLGFGGWGTEPSDLVDLDSLYRAGSLYAWVFGIMKVDDQNNFRPFDYLTLGEIDTEALQYVASTSCEIYTRETDSVISSFEVRLNEKNLLNMENESLGTVMNAFHNAIQLSEHVTLSGFTYTIGLTASVADGEYEILKMVISYAPEKGYIFDENVGGGTLGYNSQVEVTESLYKETITINYEDFIYSLKKTLFEINYGTLTYGDCWQIKNADDLEEFFNGQEDEGKYIPYAFVDIIGNVYYYSDLKKAAADGVYLGSLKGLSVQRLSIDYAGLYQDEIDSLTRGAFVGDESDQALSAIRYSPTVLSYWVFHENPVTGILPPCPQGDDIYQKYSELDLAGKGMLSTSYDMSLTVYDIDNASLLEVIHPRKISIALKADEYESIMGKEAFVIVSHGSYHSEWVEAEGDYQAVWAPEVNVINADITIKGEYGAEYAELSFYTDCFGCIAICYADVSPVYDMPLYTVTDKWISSDGMWACTTVRNESSSNGANILLAAYDANDRFVTVFASAFDNLYAGQSITVKFCLDRFSDEVDHLKTFVLNSLSDFLPVAIAK